MLSAKYPKNLEKISRTKLYQDRIILEDLGSHNLCIRDMRTNRKGIFQTSAFDSVTRQLPERHFPKLQIPLMVGRNSHIRSVCRSATIVEGEICAIWRAECLHPFILLQELRSYIKKILRWSGIHFQSISYNCPTQRSAVKKSLAG